MHFEPRLWRFTEGVRLRILWAVLVGLVADGDGERGLVLRELARLSRMQIEVEEVDSVLLGPRPHRFTRDIGADRGHYFEAESCDRRLQHDDCDERRDELEHVKEVASLRCSRGSAKHPAIPNRQQPKRRSATPGA